MAEPDTSPAGRLKRGTERPARLIRLICQMILAAGLAIALILKVYMVVLTDHQCVADAAGLGNAIRCTPTLTLMAAVLALSAGFDLAYRLAFGAIEQAITPVILGLSATVLVVISGAGVQAFGWREALVILALSASLGGFLWLRIWHDRQSKPPE